MSDTVLLVRHTEIARAWRVRCYGVSDVPLSRAGRAAIAELAIRLAAERLCWVMHSGLTRTRLLAARTAKLAGCRLCEDGDWRERDFGTWEGKSWDAIYRATGNAMDGMIDAPDEFRPGGGETTVELADRVARARRKLPAGLGVIVTHGGPIAALLGGDRGAPVTKWPTLVPAPGGVVSVLR